MLQDILFKEKKKKEERIILYRIKYELPFTIKYNYDKTIL